MQGSARASCLAVLPDGVDLVVIGIPAQFSRAVLNTTPKRAAADGLPVRNLPKGIEQGIFQTMHLLLLRNRPVSAQRLERLRSDRGVAQSALDGVVTWRQGDSAGQAAPVSAWNALIAEPMVG